jgi:hypothetical protein
MQKPSDSGFEQLHELVENLLQSFDGVHDLLEFDVSTTKQDENGMRNIHVDVDVADEGTCFLHDIPNEQLVKKFATMVVDNLDGTIVCKHCVERTWAEFERVSPLWRSKQMKM